MFKLDGMLMIGSAGTNVGKTELACALLKKFSKSHNITGIKVTTIKEKDGQCPRGGEGCGVCSSLEGVYCITEETNSKTGKDTARLLAAGANKVFWLRVLREHLSEGTTALLNLIGPDVVSICESNSLRQVVEPGLFLMARNNNLKTWKSSAQEVQKYADSIVSSNGESFNFDLDRIKLTDNRWIIQNKATLIIMAGGGSSRMGTDKSMLPIKNQSMIEGICSRLDGCFDQILISANESDKYAFLGHDVVLDKIQGQGPLMGIASSLEVSANELNFIIACDIPNINITCVNRMLNEAVESRVDIVVPTTGEGKNEPLFAVYSKSSLKTINDVLSSGKRKISNIFNLCNVKYFELEDTDQLINLNTMAEFEEFQRKLTD
ncbi:MAG: molybdenum cofactor guanylyltransferase [Phycisphaerales bacterium]|jgi:molybdopterin-guanine dinucleotide biosynthesis protein A